MATVKFYIQKPSKSSSARDEYNIYLNFFCPAYRLRFYTGEKIRPGEWNSKKQQARLTHEGVDSLNSRLENLATNAKDIFRKSLDDGRTLTKAEFLNKLSQFRGKKEDEETKTKEFFPAMDEYLQLKKGDKSDNFLRRMNTLRNLLKEFQKETGYKVTFENMTNAFREKFDSYLMKKKKHLNSTIKGNFSVLKIFLRWATQMKYNTNTAFREGELNIPGNRKDDAETIYLTEDELMRIFNLELSEYPKLYKIREAFCFSCFTGLRFSDLANVTRNNVKGDSLKITIQKTKETLDIPLNDSALSILNRNNFELDVISNQKTNDYLKDLGKMALLTDTITVIKFRGSERVETKEEKSEFLTTHTGRRTFATLSLEKGMRPEIVMAIMGLKTWKNFNKYIRLTDKVKKIEMKRVWNQPETLLKVV